MHLFTFNLPNLEIRLLNNATERPNILHLGQSIVGSGIMSLKDFSVIAKQWHSGSDILLSLPTENNDDILTEIKGLGFVFEPGELYDSVILPPLNIYFYDHVALHEQETQLLLSGKIQETELGYCRFIVNTQNIEQQQAEQIMAALKSLLPEITHTGKCYDVEVNAAFNNLDTQEQIHLDMYSTVRKWFAEKINTY